MQLSNSTVQSSSSASSIAHHNHSLTKPRGLVDMMIQSHYIRFCRRSSWCGVRIEARNENERTITAKATAPTMSKPAPTTTPSRRQSCQPFHLISGGDLHRFSCTLCGCHRRKEYRNRRIGTWDVTFSLRDLAKPDAKRRGVRAKGHL
jgi:hypothetical protein